MGPVRGEAGYDSGIAEEAPMGVLVTREFWKQRVVFVTGATGFLGGWVVRRLLELDAEVVALVRDGIPQSMFISQGDIGRVRAVFGGVSDFDLLKRAFAEHGVDTVLHLAAQPLVGVAKLDPCGTLEANVKGTWNILEAARQCKVRQVIVASSDKAYGESDRLPYTEEHPLQGKFPYDCSKSCADLIAQMFLATYGMSVSVVRCANLFGGGDLNFSRTIPGAIRATFEGNPFVIRSDGNFVRDFLYIEDAADAYLYLAEAVAGGAPQGAYNFSLEVRWTVRDCASAVLRLMGRRDLTPIVQNQASAEIREQYMSCEKARRLLAWAPAHDMLGGIEKSIGWYRSHFEQLRRARGSQLVAGA
jgi:CDP-glucose 4,6-dehydratase